MTTFSALPTEIQRYIMSLMPFWHSQRKRGVSKQWKYIADSLNPNMTDAESRNVRALSVREGGTVPWPTIFAFAWRRGTPLKSGLNWRGDLVCYPVAEHEDERIRAAYTAISTDVVVFLKWSAKIHICPFFYWEDHLLNMREAVFEPMCYIRDGEIVPDLCRCCAACASRNVACASRNGVKTDLPNKRSERCQRLLCAACCRDSACRGHERARKRHR